MRELELYRKLGDATGLSTDYIRNLYASKELKYHKYPLEYDKQEDLITRGLLCTEFHENDVCDSVFEHHFNSVYERLHERDNTITKEDLYHALLLTTIRFHVLYNEDCDKYGLKGLIWADVFDYLADEKGFNI